MLAGIRSEVRGIPAVLKGFERLRDFKRFDIEDCRDVLGECFEELRSGTMGQEFRGSLDCRVPYFKGFCPWGRRLRIGEFCFEGLKAYGLQRSGSRSKSPTYPGVYLESQGGVCKDTCNPYKSYSNPDHSYY